MNQHCSKNVVADRTVPKYIEIPCGPTAAGAIPEHHEPVSNSSFINFDCDIVSSPGSRATQDDLDEMKRMVREMVNKPASTVYEKFGLLDTEGERLSKYVRQVSMRSVDK